MTWEPKNGLHDEDVDVSDEEDGDNSFTKEDVKPNALGTPGHCAALLSLSHNLFEPMPALVASLPGSLSNGIIAPATVSKTHCWRLRGAAQINCLKHEIK